MALGARIRLNATVQEKIISALVAGNYQEIAAQYAGVGKTTYFKWLAWGREEIERLEMDEAAEPDPTKTVFANFVEAVEEARAGIEVRLTTGIILAAKDDWHAGAWFLERSFPQRYGRVDKTQISTEEGKPLEINISIPDLEAKVKAVKDAREAAK